VQFQSTEIAGDCSFFLCKLVFFFQERILFILRYFLLFFPLSSLSLSFSLSPYFVFFFFFFLISTKLKKNNSRRASIVTNGWAGSLCSLSTAANAHSPFSFSFSFQSSFPPFSLVSITFSLLFIFGAASIIQDVAKATDAIDAIGGAPIRCQAKKDPLR